MHIFFDFSFRKVLQSLPVLRQVYNILNIWFESRHRIFDSIKTTFQSYIRSPINSALFQYLKSGCLFSDLKCKITTSHCSDNLLINSKRWKIRRNELKEQLSTSVEKKEKKLLFKNCNCMRWSSIGRHWLHHNNECVICTFWYVAWEHKIVIYYNFCA